MLELRYHNAMPGWCKIVGLKVKQVPECEGGGVKFLEEDAKIIVAAINHMQEITAPQEEG